MYEESLNDRYKHVFSILSTLGNTELKTGKACGVLMADQNEISVLRSQKYARGRGGCRAGRMWSNCCHEEENENNLSACTVSSSIEGHLIKLPFICQGFLQVTNRVLILQFIDVSMLISKISLPPSPGAKSAAGYKRMCSAFPSSLSRFLRALSGLSEEHRDGQ